MDLFGEDDPAVRLQALAKVDPGRLVMVNGKHKGRTVQEVLALDPDYARVFVNGVAGRDDLRTEMLRAAFRLLGSFGDDTPEHNSLQTRFDNRAFCTAFAMAAGRKVDVLRSRYVRAAIAHGVLLPEVRDRLSALFWERHGDGGHIIHYTEPKNPCARYLFEKRGADRRLASARSFLENFEAQKARIERDRDKAALSPTYRPAEFDKRLAEHLARKEQLDAEIPALEADLRKLEDDEKARIASLDDERGHLLAHQRELHDALLAERRAQLSWDIQFEVPHVETTHNSYSGTSKSKKTGNSIDVVLRPRLWIADLGRLIDPADISAGLSQQVGDDLTRDAAHAMARPRLTIEVKPVVAEDYPAVLRQMQKTDTQYLLIGEYRAGTLPLDRLRAYFATDGREVVMLADVEAHLDAARLITHEVDVAPPASASSAGW
jgi:hypothetical protein